MPTYEYICEKCGEEFEYFQSITEEPKSTCERCGGRLERLVGAGGGLIFKGAGFYITDYKRGQSSSGSSESTQGSDKSNKKSEGSGGQS